MANLFISDAYEINNANYQSMQWIFNCFGNASKDAIYEFYTVLKMHKFYKCITSFKF